jgi:hypothetical protein
VPFRHCPEGHGKLKRVVPLFPLSKDGQVYSNMLKILSIYRLAFGQSGQHELLEHLKDLKLSDAEFDELKLRLMIRPAPLMYAQ